MPTSPTVSANELQPGDTLIYKGGTGWLSRLIRYGTDSEYSHALKYLGTKEQVLDFLAAHINEIRARKDAAETYRAREEEITRALFEKIVTINDTLLIAESDLDFKAWFWSFLWHPKKYRNGVTVQGLSAVLKRNGDHDVFRAYDRAKENFSVARFYSNALRFAALGVGYDVIGLLWQAVLASKWKFLGRRPFGVSVQNAKKVWCTEYAHAVDIFSGLPVDDLEPEETTPDNLSKKESFYFVGQLSKNLPVQC